MYDDIPPPPMYTPSMPSAPSPKPKSRFFLRQGVFYGGMATGFFLVPLVIFLLLLLIVHGGNAPRNSQVTSGNMTITMNDDLLSTGMSIGLAHAGLPFQVTNVQAHSKAGDSLELDASVPTAFGTATMTMTLAPQIDTTGHLDFQIKAIQFNGGDLSLGGLTNQLIEMALNSQFSNLGSGSVIKGLNYQLVDVHTNDGSLVVTMRLYQS
jgi:hypothetical protein